MGTSDSRPPAALDGTALVLEADVTEQAQAADAVGPTEQPA